ncbi:LysR family transcriptional regulator [Methylopila jiangsuensis]|uniref:LysR family transcriptional regulator n=1 Tax=Methylopila jiangsuensis TaxID=586230 RepID=A0A9W6JM05_9HYPH|nr:hydrogen peroxide-inducible genes activator [Methylopila jiangsuensis]MDR6284649.1 LysR family hydrogen peroxide-inducible transcriptional activator [Methylopila jiangsuensis]GLK77963.1 LysR family transcriptional regulator [Methylopila jiangsuensis]
MINLSLRQLRYFVALAELGSFSAAARRVGVTQSTLSAAIQEMETTLGVRLAERSGRRFELTAAGAALVDRAVSIVAQVDDLPNLLAQAERPLTSWLRLGVIPSVAPFLLPRALPSIREAFPELSLSVREALSRTLIGDIRSGALDAAIMALPLAVDDCETAPFWQDRFFVAAANGHRLAGRPSVVAEELAGERILLLEPGHCLRDQVLNLTGLGAEDELGEVKAMSIATLVQLAANGLGLTILPEIAVAAGVADGAPLKMIPCDGDRSSRSLVLVWRKGASRRAEFALFAEHLQGLCERHFDALADRSAMRRRA